MQCPYCQGEIENQMICDEAQGLGMVDPDDPASLVDWLLNNFSFWYKLSKGGDYESTKVATRLRASNQVH